MQFQNVSGKYKNSALEEINSSSMVMYTQNMNILNFNE